MKTLKTISLFAVLLLFSCGGGGEKKEDPAKLKLKTTEKKVEVKKQRQNLRKLSILQIKVLDLSRP